MYRNTIHLLLKSQIYMLFIYNYMCIVKEYVPIFLGTVTTAEKWSKRKLFWSRYRSDIHFLTYRQRSNRSDNRTKATWQRYRIYGPDVKRRWQNVNWKNRWREKENRTYSNPDPYGTCNVWVSTLFYQQFIWRRSRFYSILYKIIW